MRFRLSELSCSRILGACKRRIADLPDLAAWRMDACSKNNRSMLSMFQNIHKGQRCFIIGNGPSLKNMDLSLLKDEITIGMNRIYLLFDELKYETTYYACINELVLEQFCQDIDRLRMPKFISWNKRALFSSGRNNHFVRPRFSINDSFVSDPRMSVSTGGTVTYVAMQLAYFMGFSEVVLIGVDHNFLDKGTPNVAEVVSSETDRNHFHPNYFPKGIRWQPPDLLRSELAYSLARKAFEADGRRIYDATLGGKLDVFEKVDFYSLFDRHYFDGHSQRVSACR